MSKYGTYVVFRTSMWLGTYISYLMCRSKENGFSIIYQAYLSLPQNSIHPNSLKDTYLDPKRI